MKRGVLLTMLFAHTLFAENIIEIHTCYGTPSKLIVEGRLYEERQHRQKSKSDSWFDNIKHSLAYLFSDEKKESKIELLINGKIYIRESDDEGYFSFETSTLTQTFSSNQPVEIRLKDTNITKRCQALIIDTNIPQIGIISDFDDTVVISHVTNKLKLAYTLLLKNYKQRKVVAGMKERFHTLLDNTKNPILFFVTGSPKQLQEPIEQFLDLHHFPRRIVITKKIHGNYADALFDQLEYKYEKIKDLILLYPNITWIFFGDSGEKDAAVYAKIAEEYPSKVKDIYIRDVKTGIIKHIKWDKLMLHKL